MFLDPDKLNQANPAEVLEAAAEAHLGLDHRFLHSLADRREEALPAVLAFAKRNRSEDRIDLAPEIIALLRHWRAPEALSFLISYIAEAPDEIPDEAMEAVVEIGQPAVEPLLELYEKLDKPDSGDVAFLLASLGVRDDRISQILSARREHDASDAEFLLEVYGAQAVSPGGAEEPFNIWDSYPEIADPDLDLLDEDARLDLLEHPVVSMRAAAATSFFNRELKPDERARVLHSAQTDTSPVVRARAWEALLNDTDDPAIVEAMLEAMRNPETSMEERGGLMVGLAAESDRNEVRAAIEQLYREPAGRAKAMEAMWRSVHPSFRDYFAKHLNDSDLEVRRAAVWGIGYYGLRSELNRLRDFFDDEDLRADALFAYTLAAPAELSRGRMKGLLARIEKDAHGLSEMEEDLVKMALDERLLLAGKEPYFSREED
ncbi:MAG TPA: HEAT repeat domain-containing protein [Bryobacteraceae bacterium]